MRKFTGILTSLYLLLIAGDKTAHADKSIDFEISADFYGKYIWRGQNLNDDPVFQPGLNATYGNLTAGIWGNLDTTNINDRSGDFSELDLSLDYSGDLPGIKGIGYSVGVIHYDFPGAAADGSRVPDTTELYWGLNFDLPLSPAITVYHDLDEAEGSYVSLAASHNVEKIHNIGPNTPVAMEICASLGWGSGSYNKYYWGTEQSKLNDLAFSVAFPFTIKGWTVTPSLNYVTLVSDDIRDTDVYGTNSDFFFAGVSISKKF